MAQRDGQAPPDAGERQPFLTPAEDALLYKRLLQARKIYQQAHAYFVTVPEANSAQFVAALGHLKETTKIYADFALEYYGNTL